MAILNPAERKEIREICEIMSMYFNCGVTVEWGAKEFSIVWDKEMTDEDVSKLHLFLQGGRVG